MMMMIIVRSMDSLALTLQNQRTLRQAVFDFIDQKLLIVIELLDTSLNLF